MLSKNEKKTRFAQQVGTMICIIFYYNEFRIFFFENTVNKLYCWHLIIKLKFYNTLLS